MDKFDKHILSLLQKDCTTAVSLIAEKVGLSTTPCWRRIQALESKGIIKKRVALAEPEKMNVGLCVFVMVKTNQHTQQWLDSFTSHVNDIPEVIEFYRMSGDVDYLLRVVIPDMKAYDKFYKKLIKGAEFTDISASFAMEQIKYTTELPIEYLI